ncbi:MAG: hypothetical protein JWO06_1380, partial [Bacteroidota bacterium]|nr:hypothetical protein [Bacteroidota bacterium]
MIRICILVFFTLTGFFAEAQEIHCLRLNTPVVLDGDPSEWPQPFRYYDGATKLQFAMA